MQMPKPKECSECGESSVFHRSTYVTIVVDDFLSGLFRPNAFTRFASRPLMLLERKTTPYLLEGLIRIGFAKRLLESDDETTLLGSTIWSEARARNIRVEEFRLFGLPRNTFLATLPNGKKIAYEGMPLPVSELDRVWWMDDKALLKKEFIQYGFPVARGAAVRTLGKAKKLFASLTPPVIVKPQSGSGSRHTTLHIDSEEELARGFALAKQIAPSVMVEEELVGTVYRLTVVNGKFVAALRRDQPFVIGDGQSTVRELVEETNKDPKRKGSYFKLIQFGTAMDRELAWQDISLDTVLEKGKRIHLHQKMNWSVGATTTDETAIVHADTIALLEEVAKKLKAPIVGADFVIGDITRSWKEQERCGILECNSMPFIEIHQLPFYGEPINVSGYVWDMVN